jgi:protein gp37
MKKPGDWWDKSLNVFEGCTRVSEACRSCWALAMLHRFRGQEPGEFRIYPNRKEQALNRIKPTRYFVNSLSDSFHEKLFDYRMELFNLMDDIGTIADICEQHTFCLLTKRPQNITRFLYETKRGAFGPNVWLGVTAENQARYNERWSILKDIPASVKFVSMEPLLGPIDISKIDPKPDWIIVGPENGPKKRFCDPDWIVSLEAQAANLNIPFWDKSAHGRPVRQLPKAGAGA